MALTTTTVTGIIDLPNGATPVAARVIFELTGWAKEGENIFVSGPVEVAVEPDGSFSVSLQTTEDLPVNYQVAVGYRIPSLSKDVTTRLGQIAVPALGPVVLGDLLTIPAPVPTVPDALAQALAAAAQAIASAESTAPVLEDREAAEAAAEAAAISAGIALGAAAAAASDASAAANAQIAPNVSAAVAAQNAAEAAAYEADLLEQQTQTLAASAASSAKFYGSIADGRAAVSDADTFGVLAGGSDGLTDPTLYRRDGASAQTKIAALVDASVASAFSQNARTFDFLRRENFKVGEVRGATIQTSPPFLRRHGLSMLQAIWTLPQFPAALHGPLLSSGMLAIAINTAMPFELKLRWRSRKSPARTRRVRILHWVIIAPTFAGSIMPVPVGLRFRINPGPLLMVFHSLQTCPSAWVTRPRWRSKSGLTLLRR